MLNGARGLPQAPLLAGARHVAEHVAADTVPDADHTYAHDTPQATADRLLLFFEIVFISESIVIAGRSHSMDFTRQRWDVFTYDLATRHLVRVTDWRGTDTDPMWSGRQLYFLSDRGPGGCGSPSIPAQNGAPCSSMPGGSTVTCSSAAS